MAARRAEEHHGAMLRTWLSQSHSGAREIAGLAALYGLYEVIRGAGGENVQVAMQNTADIVAFEQAVGVYVERGVQQAFEAVPFAPAFLGLLYVLLHFAGTAVAKTIADGVALQAPSDSGVPPAQAPHVDDCFCCSHCVEVLGIMPAEGSVVANSPRPPLVLAEPRIFGSPLYHPPQFSLQ